jgi:hypothetical protein
MFCFFRGVCLYRAMRHDSCVLRTLAFDTHVTFMPLSGANTTVSPNPFTTTSIDQKLQSPHIRPLTYIQHTSSSPPPTHHHPSLHLFLHSYLAHLSIYKQLQQAPPTCTTRNPATAAAPKTSTSPANSSRYDAHKPCSTQTIATRKQGRKGTGPLQRADRRMGMETGTGRVLGGGLKSRAIMKSERERKGV